MHEQVFERGGGEEELLLHGASRRPVAPDDDHRHVAQGLARIPPRAQFLEHVLRANAVGAGDFENQPLARDADQAVEDGDRLAHMVQYVEEEDIVELLAGVVLLDVHDAIVDRAAENVGDGPGLRQAVGIDVDADDLAGAAADRLVAEEAEEAADVQHALARHVVGKDGARDVGAVLAAGGQAVGQGNFLVPRLFALEPFFDLLARPRTRWGAWGS